MTKKEMQQHLRDALAQQGFSPVQNRVEALVYSDEDHYRRGAAQHDALTDFTKWGDLPRYALLQPGYVIDLFVYEKIPGEYGELIHAFPVTLPGGHDDSLVEAYEEEAYGRAERSHRGNPADSSSWFQPGSGVHHWLLMPPGSIIGGTKGKIAVARSGGGWDIHFEDQDLEALLAGRWPRGVDENKRLESRGYREFLGLEDYRVIRRGYKENPSRGNPRALGSYRDGELLADRDRWREYHQGKLEMAQVYGPSSYEARQAHDAYERLLELEAEVDRRGLGQHKPYRGNPKGGCRDGGGGFVPVPWCYDEDDPRRGGWKPGDPDPRGSYDRNLDKAWDTRRAKYGEDGLSRKGERAIAAANKRRSKKRKKRGRRTVKGFLGDF
tara:strand:+ start:408 stop:1553 length:1146 start_codon:yes stop_codon:yes gene_type:complete